MNGRFGVLLAVRAQAFLIYINDFPCDGKKRCSCKYDGEYKWSVIAVPRLCSDYVVVDRTATNVLNMETTFTQRKREEFGSCREWFEGNVWIGN